MEVSFLPPDCTTQLIGQDSQQQKTQCLTKISQHEMQPSTPTSKLSAGLQNINNTNEPFKFLVSNSTYLIQQS